jgi:hypothetical protein
LVVIGLLAIRAGLEYGPLTGAAVGVLAVTVSVAGLIRPASVRLLFLVLTLVTLPIGWVVSHALLALTYFVTFAPLALFFRLIGRDALKRNFEPARASYWEPKLTPTDPARYLRTF